MPVIIPRLSTLIASASLESDELIASASLESDENTGGNRTELDSHANMAVVGRESVVFDDTGQTCTVNAFTESAGKLEKVPIVDVAIAYDCPLQAKTYILLMRNCLHIPEIKHNLLPPFIVREAGHILDECPKFQASEPSIKNHSIYIKEFDLRIHFNLTNTFSYFQTRKPTAKELEGCDKIFITPDSTSWEPHSQHYSSNEEAMMNIEGEIIAQDERVNNIVDDHEVGYKPFPTVSEVNAKIDKILEMDDQVMDAPKPQDDSEEFEFYSKLSDNVFEGRLSSSFGTLPDLRNDGKLFCPEEIDLVDESLFESDISRVESNKSSGVTPDHLSKVWMIPEEQADKVIERNTQLNRQSCDSELSRQFSTNDRMLRYKRIKSYFFTDTMFVTDKAKSRRGNKMLQVFVSDKGFIAVYPMKLKSQFKDALHLFCKEIGVPVSLVVDPSGEQTSKDVRKFCNQVGTTLRILQESTQWANRAELYIGFLKESVRKDLSRSNCPLSLWDYCAERRALIHNLIPRDLFQTGGNTPYEYQFGVQGDISNLCQFGWYEWCYYREEGKNLFPQMKEILGRVLGPSKNEGNEMAQNVLTHKGIVLPRRSVRKLTQREVEMDSEKKKRSQFDEMITKLLGNSMIVPTIAVNPQDVGEFDYDERNDDSEEPEGWMDSDSIDEKGVPTFEHSLGDTLVNAEVLMPQGDSRVKCKVKRRHKSDDGQVTGQFHQNPMLNSIIYDVEFPNGAVREYGANIIAENMYSTLDEHGHQQQIMDGILDHSKDDTAVSMEDKYLITKSGQRRLRKSTRGWKLLVRWKDESEEWIPLRILKETYPCQIATYAVVNNLADEPAGSVHTTEKGRYSKCCEGSPQEYFGDIWHKRPSTVGEAHVLDKENNNTLWQDAISLVMGTILPALDFPNDNKAPVGYAKSSGHIVFDVKWILPAKPAGLRMDT